MLTTVKIAAARIFFFLVVVPAAGRALALSRQLGTEMLSKPGCRDFNLSSLCYRLQELEWFP